MAVARPSRAPRPPEPRTEPRPRSRAGPAPPAPRQRRARARLGVRRAPAQVRRGGRAKGEGPAGPGRVGERGRARGRQRWGLAGVAGGDTSLESLWQPRGAGGACAGLFFPAQRGGPGRKAEVGAPGVARGARSPRPWRGDSPLEPGSAQPWPGCATAAAPQGCRRER